MKRYFTDITLTLRTALLIDFQYNRDLSGSDVFTEELNKKFIEDNLGMIDHYFIIAQIYSHYNNSESIIQSTNQL